MHMWGDIYNYMCGGGSRKPEAGGGGGCKPGGTAEGAIGDLGRGGEGAGKGVALLPV